MPAVYFHVRWPDQTESHCYSPSTVIGEFFKPDTRYPLPEFLQRANDGLHAASERVRAKFGFACSSAMDQLARIEKTAQAFDASTAVHVLSID